MVKISIQILVSKKQTPGELYPGESNKTYNHRTVFKNTKCSPLLVEIHIYLCDTVPLKACEKGVKKLPCRLPYYFFYIFRNYKRQAIKILFNEKNTRYKSVFLTETYLICKQSLFFYANRIEKEFTRAKTTASFDFMN